MMKKNQLVLNILICGMLLLLTNCKKGEEDPTISFKTRKARVTGDWHLKTGTTSLTEMDKTKGYSTLLQFDGSGYTRTETPIGGTPTIYIGKYSMRISFKKDGSFSLAEIINGDNLMASGTWNFTSNIGKYKNKECIVVAISAVTGGGTNGHLINKYSTEFVYQIVGLEDKEMKIECSNPIYIDADGSKLSIQCKYTLSQ